MRVSVCVGLTVEIDAGVHRRSDSVLHRVRVIVLVHDPSNGAAVGHHETFESPLFPRDPLQLERVGAGGHAVDGVIGAHHAGRAGIAHARLERRQVALDQITIGHARVELVAVRAAAARIQKSQ